MAIYLAYSLRLKYILFEFNFIKSGLGNIDYVILLIVIKFKTFVFSIAKTYIINTVIKFDLIIWSFISHNFFILNWIFYILGFFVFVLDDIISIRVDHKIKLVLIHKGLVLFLVFKAKPICVYLFLDFSILKKNWIWISQLL